MKRLKAFLVLCIVSLSISGCQPSNIIQNNIGGAVYSLPSNKSNSERAEYIKNEILQIEGVTDAAVAITGKSALIGIKTSFENNEEIDRLKSESIIIARNADNLIMSTAITANDEIFEMIKQLDGAA